jgi:arginine:agmatine antiporter
MSSFAALAPLTMFAYLGLESATVPAGDVINPSRTIPRSTLLGVAVAMLLYVLGTTVVLGVVPRAQLITSAAPFADAARLMWGPAAASVIGVAGMISSLGALNGWTLLMGQVPMAAARDDLFPPIFARTSSRGVPAYGIVCSAILATALILIQARESHGFAAFYSLVVNLATMTAVVPYAFCALAVGLVSARAKGESRVPRPTIVEAIAFVFSLFTIYGCGPAPVLYGFILLMLGIPAYVWLQRRRGVLLDATLQGAASAPATPVLSPLVRRSS